MAGRLAAMAARAAAGQVRGLAGIAGIGTVGGAPSPRCETQLARAALGRRTTRQGAAADPARPIVGLAAELARVASPLDVADGLGDAATTVAAVGIAGTEVEHTGAAQHASPPRRTIGRRRRKATRSRVGRRGGVARGTVVGWLGDHVGPGHGRGQHDHDPGEGAPTSSRAMASRRSTLHGGPWYSARPNRVQARSGRWHTAPRTAKSATPTAGAMHPCKQVGPAVAASTPRYRCGAPARTPAPRETSASSASRAKARSAHRDQPPVVPPSPGLAAAH